MQGCWCQPGNRYLDSPAHEQVEAILRPVTGRRQAAGPRAGREPSGIQVRIEATGLPGRNWRPATDTRPRNLHIGIQPRNNRDQMLGLRPADAATAAWSFPATAVPTPARMDLKGPYIQGRPGARYICLSWGTIEDNGAFAMVMRAKLMLDAIDPATLEAARKYGRLIARLKLTDARGNPLSAAVRPPLIDWTASSAG